MSWGKTICNISLDEVDDIELEESTIVNASACGTLGETKEQFAKAKAAVKQLIQSGVVGNPSTKRFNVSFGGHSNANQEPNRSWANPTISISISQAYPTV